MPIEDITKTIKIENVVASTSISSKIDLERVSELIEGAEYNKKRFPGAIYRLKDPKLAVLVFGSGKIVCTGAKKISNVEIGVTKIFEPEQFPGLVYRIKDPKSVVLLFGSGKMIITGCKTPEDSKLVVIKIVNDLDELGLL
jgi:transcription initiation factor TFIID TATA-box-binding protein